MEATAKMRTERNVTITQNSILAPANHHPPTTNARGNESIEGVAAVVIRLIVPDKMPSPGQQDSNMDERISAKLLNMCASYGKNKLSFGRLCHYYGY